MSRDVQSGMRSGMGFDFAAYFYHACRDHEYGDAGDHPVLFCSIMGVFILSSAMPKHGVLVWTLPLMLSCHYYSKI